MIRETAESNEPTSIYVTTLLFRYKLKNMLQIGIIPGTSTPKDIWSFLKPTIDELHVLEKEGMRIILPDEVIVSRVHLLYVNGDIPAIGKLIGHHHGHRYMFSGLDEYMHPTLNTR